MSGLPTLHSPRLLLRPFTLADAPIVHRLAGDPAVAHTTQNIPHPYLDGMADAWIETHAPLFASGERLTLAIQMGSNLVGAVALGIERSHQRAELGYWVGQPYWGKGFATEATVAILAFGFRELDLNRIHAVHLTRNPASGRVMQKAGMQFEGIHRQHVWKDGRPEDLARYAALRHDAPWKASTAR